jgi:hypothetical protein
VADALLDDVVTSELSCFVPTFRGRKSNSILIGPLVTKRSVDKSMVETGS